MYNDYIINEGIITWPTGAREATDMMTSTSSKCMRVIPTQVQHPEAVNEAKRGRRRSSERQSLSRMKWIWSVGTSVNGPWRPGAKWIQQLEHHGQTRLCMASTTANLRKWLKSGNPTSGWKRLDWKTAPEALIMAAQETSYEYKSDWKPSGWYSVQEHLYQVLYWKLQGQSGTHIQRWWKATMPVGLPDADWQTSDGEPARHCGE